MAEEGVSLSLLIAEEVVEIQHEDGDRLLELLGEQRLAVLAWWARKVHVVRSMRIHSRSRRRALAGMWLRLGSEGRAWRLREPACNNLVIDLKQDNQSCTGN